MSELESEGQRITRLARPARNLSEALGIKKERLVHLATIFTECVKNDESAMDSLANILSLWHAKKIDEKEFAMLCFDFGWYTALNATRREIDRSILGIMFLDKTSGEIDRA